jgi:hypothetical protein
MMPPRAARLSEVSMHLNRCERWCVGWHRRRWIVFRDEGSHEHVRRPKCGCEFGINHALRMILPWRVVGPEIVRIESRQPNALGRLSVRGGDDE